MKDKATILPLVSIITINYNHEAVTCELLRSISSITYPNIEVIVVDNDSDHGSIKIVKEQFPNAIIVNSPINYGFAAGNNYGIMRARGKYILLLNNDTVVTPDFLQPMVSLCEQNPLIGSVSPMIRFFSNQERIQYAGSTDLNPFTLRNRAVGWNETDRGQYKLPEQTAYSHGAAMLIPIEVIKKVGMMSYAYFLYYEEADWCHRLKEAGYQIWVQPLSLIFHKESVSTGRNSPLKVYYQNRGRLIFLIRNLSGWAYIIAILYQFSIAIPKNTLKYILTAQPDLLKAYYKAIVWSLKNYSNPELQETPKL